MKRKFSQRNICKLTFAAASFALLSASGATCIPLSQALVNREKILRLICVEI